MSSKKGQKGGKEIYIKEQDTQSEIYISDDDDRSIDILFERDIKTAEKESGNRRKSGRTPKEPAHCSCCDTSPGKHCSSRKVSPGKSSGLTHSPKKTLSSQKTKDRDSSIETKKLALNRSNSPSEEPSTSGETEDSIGSGKKRNPLPQNLSTTSPKRVKKDLTKKMSDIPDRPLQVELLMEKKREPFKRRSINTIMEELDTISRKLKESYEKSNPPNYWGTPIVKQSSEKWDPNYIPEQLLELYEKGFEMNIPGTSSSASESASESQSDYKPATESKTTRSCPEGVDEEAYEASEYEHLGDTIPEDLYSSNSSQGRMTLRSMTQTRQGFEERISSDIGKDNYGTDRLLRKGSGKSGRDKRSSATKRRAISELERTHDPHSQFLDDESVDPNASFEKLKLDDSAPSTSFGAVKSHMEEKAIALPRIVEEEQVACPICGKNFEKKRIESHATHCATETFRD